MDSRRPGRFKNRNYLHVLWYGYTDSRPAPVTPSTVGLLVCPVPVATQASSGSFKQPKPLPDQRVAGHYETISSPRTSNERLPVETSGE